MTGTSVTVRALPVDQTNPETAYLVECTMCGPLGTYDGATTDRECITHLAGHGIDVSMYEKDQ